MIKWHINLNERKGIMKKKNSELPKPFFKDKGETGSKENKRKRSKNYAALASVNRKYYKTVEKYEMLISLLAVSPFLYAIFFAEIHNVFIFASLGSGLAATVPSVIIGGLLVGLMPDTAIVEDVDKARKFLLEAGQEASRKKNINILLNRYYKGNWQKIEDMLYEKRKVFSAESVELVSGNMSNENLKEAVPAK